jgi:hypothetical protein
VEAQKLCREYLLDMTADHFGLEDLRGVISTLEDLIQAEALSVSRLHQGEAGKIELGQSAIFMSGGDHKPLAARYDQILAQRAELKQRHDAMPDLMDKLTLKVGSLEKRLKKLETAYQKLMGGKKGRPR